jgi:NIMA (never in mitosis gene a)-related kinase
MLSLTEKEKENALNEVRILASINHPNVIGYKEAFIDEPSNCLCLVMEYADNGDLF